MHRTRLYKVVAIVASGERVLLSPDADCWQCEARWRQGQVLEVPLKLVDRDGDRFLLPDWQSMGITAARHWKLKDPIVMVMEYWGRDVADQHF